MVKPRNRSGEPSAGEQTRERIIEATLLTLREEGIVGTSARAIARRGDFNQALIFYHFGGINDAVVAAVAEMSRRRMARYAERLQSVGSLSELVEMATELHREDVEQGTMTVLTQAFAGAGGDPTMGPALYERLEPWLSTVEASLAAALGDRAVAGHLPLRDLGYAASALYLGIELLDALDPERGAPDTLFETIGGLARVLEALLDTPLVQGLLAPGDAGPDPSGTLGP